MKSFYKNHTITRLLISLILLSLFASLNSSLLSFNNNQKEVNKLDVNLSKNNPSETFVCSMNGKNYLARYITQEEVETMKKTIELREEEKNYNIIIDGHGTGLAPPTQEDLDRLIGKIKIIRAIPESKPKNLKATQDLSSEIYFPSVGNQMQQGSCAAWASTYYAYGYLEAKDNGWDASSGNPDYLLSPAWTYNKVTTTAGSWMTENAQILLDWGCATMSTMPYDDSDNFSWGNETAWREAPYHRAYDYYLMDFDEDNPNTTIDAIKNMITGGTPVTFAFDAYEYDSAFSDENYIMSSSEYASSTYNHAQCIVGFDDSISDDGDVGAFRVVNSWGLSFGDSGYYWLTYEALKEIGLVLNDFTVHLCVIEDRIDYLPSLIATWEFEPAPTRMLNLTTLGVGPYSAPLATKTPWYAFDGNYPLPEFMSLDISKFQSYYDINNEVNFFLEVGSSTTTGTISSFKVERYISGSLEEITPESPDVPKITPGYVNSLFIDLEHDLKVILDTPMKPEISNTYIINAEVINNGNHDESNVILILYLNNLILNSTIISTLPSGDDVTVTYSWTPLGYGTYNFSGYAPQIGGEFYTVNNIATKVIHILELKNYTMIPNNEYHWINASSGEEWFLVDDGYVNVPLPFDFQFYNDSFSTIHISANGYLSFTDTSPSQFINDPFPSGDPSNMYMIAPFWDDLYPPASGHIYVESFDSYWVVEWRNLSHYYGPWVGTFEVVLYETGEIAFNYKIINFTDEGYTCGLNLGGDIHYYNSYQGLDNNTHEFSILFTYSLLPGSFILNTNAGNPSDDDGVFNLVWTESSRVSNYSVYQHSSYITVINGSLTPLAEEITEQELPLSGYYIGTYYFIIVAHNKIGDTISNCVLIVVFYDVGGIPGYELLFIMGTLGITIILLNKKISKKIRNTSSTTFFIIP